MFKLYWGKSFPSKEEPVCKFYGVTLLGGFQFGYWSKLDISKLKSNATLTIDEDSKTAYLYLDKNNKKSANTVELDKDVLVDLDEDKRLIGIEFLDLKRLPKGLS